MADDFGGGWEKVNKGSATTSNEGIMIKTSPPKGQSCAARNARRRQRKEEDQARAARAEQEIQAVLEGRQAADEFLCPGLTRALSESLTIHADAVSATETPEASRQRRLRACRKRLAQIDALRAKPSESLDEAQRAKLSRRQDIEDEIIAIEAESLAEEESEAMRKVALIHDAFRLPTRYVLRLPL